MKKICLGFLTFNGWKSSEHGVGIIDKTVLNGDTVNPILLTLVDKDDGDLPPMVVDVSAYSERRRSEISNKLANIASIAISEGLTPCIPMYAADAGSDNPALLPPKPNESDPHPAISVKEAFEAVGLPMPDFVECPYHVIEKLLNVIRLVKFTIGGGHALLVDFEIHLAEFTNVFEANMWKKLINGMLKLNAGTVFAIFSRARETDLTCLLNSAAGHVNENEYASYAVSLLRFLLALKKFLSLLNEKMSIVTMEQFKDVREEFLKFARVTVGSKITKHIDSLIHNIGIYISYFCKYKAPFRPRSMSTYTHYSWKFSHQSNINFTLSPSFGENIAFLVKAIDEGIAEKEVHCLWGTSRASIIARHDVFIPPSPVDATIETAPYQHHALNLRRLASEAYSLEDLAFTLLAIKKAREYSAVKENRQICSYFSHRGVKELRDLILSIAPYIPLNLQ